MQPSDSCDTGAIAQAEAQRYLLLLAASIALLLLSALIGLDLFAGTGIAQEAGFSRRGAAGVALAALVLSASILGVAEADFAHTTRVRPGETER